MPTVGEALITLLAAHGVDTVFGIPGVHTVELYRGLAGSAIRHVTPRHEQGAAFMADGFARASGRPGVAFVITGPGLTNALTAMAQARADSSPLLVISSVNQRASLGKGLGYLHELPDQLGLAAKVALLARRIETPEELQPALAEAFALFATARPGPVHIEIPLDVMAQPAAQIGPIAELPAPPQPEPQTLDRAAALLAQAQMPLILAGGGACRAEPALRQMAEMLDAPVVTTANGRGLLFGHDLGVPASPSLPAIRALMAEADVVLAAGTEFGPTDYDMYANGGFVLPQRLIRIDIDKAQLERRPATVAIQADCASTLDALAERLTPAAPRGGAERAAMARDAARGQLEPYMHAQLAAVEIIRDTLPTAIIAGDSTQPVYAANLYYDHDRPGGWFNAATGYGALGFGPPAAIGAALAVPETPVVCLTGDGGLQFVLAEIGAAREARAAVIFVVWNNRGYREIETSMRDAGVEPVGVSPLPPDFVKIAEAYGLPAERLDGTDGLAAALRRTRTATGPALIEVVVP